MEKVNSIKEISWDDINNIMTSLSKKVKEDGKPDIIIGIQRGGLIPGVIMSHKLNIREMITFNIKCTENDEINASKIEPQVGANIDLTVIDGKDVLLVDDIVGSGSTYLKLMDILGKYNPKRIRTLTCVLNMNNWEKNQNCDPYKLIEYVGIEVRNWLVFPWES